MEIIKQSKYIVIFSILLFVFALQTHGQVNAIHTQQISLKKIEAPLERILMLRPGRFVYNTGTHEREYSFSTQEVQTVFPELVKEKKTTYMFGKNVYRDRKEMTFDASTLIPVLVASIQQQQQDIEVLKKEIQVLKQQREK